MDFEKIEWLDLQINQKSRNIISLDKHKFICRFDNIYKHELHGEDHLINSLIDLQISLGESLKFQMDQYMNRIYRAIEKLTNVVFDIKKIIQKSEDNLDYIKNQNNFVIKKLNQDKENLDKIYSLLDNLFITVTQEPKAIEKESKIILEKADEKIRQVEALLHEIKDIILK